MNQIFVTKTCLT